MQERRTAIRVRHWARVQYCASTDLVPRDGRLIDVSERGAGLWTREPHAADERVTLTFLVLGDEEPLTATGIVRWAGRERIRRSWYPLGLEWLPLEETTRYRLSAFLAQRADVASQQSASPEGAGIQFGWMARAVWLPVAVAGLVVGLLAGIVHLRRESKRLALSVQQRNARIQTLEADRASLEKALGAAREQVSASAQELARLDTQIQTLQHVLTQSEAEATVYRGSYTRVSEEREQLLTQMHRLEQQREELSWKLRVAIRALMTVQTRAAQPPEASEPMSSISGNRGYLVKDGRPTPIQRAAWIRVHTPESSPSAGRRPRS
jgi:outer membrane murein-binding lipoprotein Lpp